MEQFTLFDNPQIKTELLALNDTAMAHIQGLQYIPEYITPQEHDNLFEIVNQEEWLNDLKRRVQHYGYRYDYKVRSIDYSMKIGDLPQWTMDIAQRLYQEGHIKKNPEQLIVNEYLTGQGIANHVDCKPCFGDTIISLSLGSACMMDFKNQKTKENYEVFLAPRSLVVLKEDARYIWTHGIRPRKTDKINGVRMKRTTRISLTFRNIILQK